MRPASLIRWSSTGRLCSGRETSSRPVTDYRPYDRRRRNLLELLPPILQPGSEVWRWGIIGMQSLRMALGVVLAVIGTGLAEWGSGWPWVGSACSPSTWHRPSPKSWRSG